MGPWDPPPHPWDPTGPAGPLDPMGPWGYTSPYMYAYLNNTAKTGTYAMAIKPRCICSITAILSRLCEMPRLSLRKRSNEEMDRESNHLRDAIESNGWPSLIVNYSEVKKLRRIKKALRARWSQEDHDGDSQSTSVSDYVSSFEYEKEEAFERAMQAMAECAEEREKARELLYDRERMAMCDVDIASAAGWERARSANSQASDDELMELIE